MKTDMAHKPARFSWALEVLNTGPSDVVLEVGCGAGILAGRIARTLVSGKLIALDRSEAMIKLASKRNRELLESGKIEFMNKAYAKADFPEKTFDKIIAFNVSLFWKDFAKELLLVHRQLKPGGQFFLFHQPPKPTAAAIAQVAENQLLQHNFVVEQKQFKELPVDSAFCLVAKPIQTDAKVNL
jgi:ubiquinone/menaquinone biosynthesis C-methylase UbiE